ncbi:ImmA/IrrE family metallo-endopeptidase [Chitinophaga nivalis]|uniref:ImmA/IrrE family metallo-endopeptidase n=1 Tax=Chitinophaga nivalis TaxID=2991709 RepID=A0ABT3IQ28_9BACT|nr:ImmA/IrrE family metallo-endopeptidase [Chitinophaga nivalis]MCW3464244.1 ImmA/IrrE family metallo-endopeptidase [Chitinophaga nivalis]MCW3486065.1 ImmA/IrrE family metallo-endopeptidase [Chitinophaga nivalis]
MIASKAAQDLLFECSVNDPRDVDIEDLIIYKNGIIKEVPLSGCDGRMVMKNGKAIVSVNSKIEYPKKRRFVLAHELGHIILHPDREASFTDNHDTLEDYRKGSQEKEANDFAAELLMPAQKFKSACIGQNFSFSVLSKLAESFDTTLSATAFRYVDYGNFPICLFYCKGGIVQYWKKSNDFWSRIPDNRHLAVPSGSVASEYYEKGKIYSKEWVDQDIFKSTWFELRDEDEDLRMKEFCIITPKFDSVLSVVWQPNKSKR